MAQFTVDDWRDWETYLIGIFAEDPVDGFWWIARQYKYSYAHWTMRVLNTGVEIMARGKGSAGQKQTAPAKGAWTEFVNVSLQGVAWEDIEREFPAGKKLFELLETVIEDGYRVAFSYDQRTDSVSCSMSAKGDDHVNGGKTLVSFAQTWVGALQTSLYKHFVVLSTDWTVKDEVQQRPSFG